jgi:hypothetical protein
MADSSNPTTGQMKPKMQIAIEHLDRAHDHMAKAMTIMSSIIFDLQKGADFIVGYRDSLIKTVEQMGGDTATSVESQMRDFVPRQYRAPEQEGDTQRGD